MSTLHLLARRSALDMTSPIDDDNSEDLFGSEEEGEEAISGVSDSCSSPEASVKGPNELDDSGSVDSKEGDSDEEKTMQQLLEDALEKEGLINVGEESDGGNFFYQLDGAVQNQIVRALHKADQGRFSADVSTLVLQYTRLGRCRTSTGRSCTRSSRAGCRSGIVAAGQQSCSGRSPPARRWEQCKASAFVLSYP